jgi:uncharacterized membrane protein
LAITRQSLWIDEGFTLWFASHGSFQSFFKALVGTPGAPGDPQFIFYLLHMWGWIKLFGASELSLRAANIPFAVIFIYTMIWASRRLFWHPSLWALFCLSPFFWFYLNEARPYLALMAFSSVASVSLLAYLNDPWRYRKSAPWLCLISLFLAWGTHILAMFLFPALLVLIATCIARDSELKTDFRRHWSRAALCCLPAFIALGSFYSWVSSYGVNKSNGNPGLGNLVFALYEFTGFAGLGPPRNEIRQNLNLDVFLPYWPLLLLGSIALAAAVVFVFRSSPSKMARNLLLSIIVGLAAALTMSKMQHFQVLGRHLAVFFPLLLMVFMLAPKNPPFMPKISRKVAIAAIALGLVWGISDLRLVFLSQYGKDSYKEASSIAMAQSRQEGAVILWAADPVIAKYYGLTVSPDKSSAPAAAVDASSWSADRTNAYFTGLSRPMILVLSKPDLFDKNGAWRALIRGTEPPRIAELNAISIYEWQPLQKDGACSACSALSFSPENLMVDNLSQQHFLGQNKPAQLSQSLDPQSPATRSRVTPVRERSLRLPRQFSR